MWYQTPIEEIELPCPRLPAAFDGLRVLHLSDMHITRWTRTLSAWEEKLGGLKPHVVAITGDLGHRSWLWKRSLPNVRRLVESLSPTLGTFFILGNHDSLKLGAALETPACRLLENETVFLEPSAAGFRISAASANGPRLALIGINQHRRIDTDILAALRDVRPDDFKLMLLHYPDLIYPAVSAGADICLAGHTHGGQICWPDGRPLFRQDTLPHTMCTGVHRVNGTWMVVNRGIGVAGLRLRMFCPPHVMMLTLRCK
jgi:predicted MPP superfamily phosphohydrolase